MKTIPATSLSDYEHGYRSTKTHYQCLFCDVNYEKDRFIQPLIAFIPPKMHLITSK